MKIPYDTPAQKYTGALLGSFTGQLPPASAPYTRLLKSIIDNTEMPIPNTELLKNIYKFFGGDIDVGAPKSRLSRLLQYGIFSDRYSITDKTDDSITVFDNMSSQSFTMILDDFLEFLWAEIITTAIDDEELIPPENRNISTWTKNISSIPVFDNHYANGINTLTYQGGSGFEHIYLPITVKPNTYYSFSVDFHSPTGFDCPGYDNVYDEYIAVTYVKPDKKGLNSLALLGKSESLSRQASEIPITYSVSFNSGNYTTVYLVLDFGYIADFVTVTLDYRNISLKENYMPQMNGITGLYEYSKNVDALNGVWKSKLKGGTDIEIHNPIITNDYIEFVGSDESYAKLTYGGEPDGNAQNSTQCIRYAVFKTLSGIYTEWRTIIGNETTLDHCSTIAMGASGIIQFTRDKIYAYNCYCKDWHVVCWTSNSASGTSTLWVDGVKKGSAGRCSGWASDTYFCKGPSWSFTDNNTAFKFFAIGDTIHSDEDIKKNSEYLLRKFIGN